MDLRFWGVIVMAFFIIMMISFGGESPIDAYRKEKELEAQGKDALILSIEEYNAKSQGGGLSGLMGGGGSTPGSTLGNSSGNSGNFISNYAPTTSPNYVPVPGGAGYMPAPTPAPSPTYSPPSGAPAYAPPPGTPAYAPPPGTPGYIPPNNATGYVAPTPNYIPAPDGNTNGGPEIPAYNRQPQLTNPYLAAQPYYRPKNSTGNPQNPNQGVPAPVQPSNNDLQDMHNGYYPPKPLLQRPMQLSPHSRRDFYIDIEKKVAGKDEKETEKKLIGFAGNDVYMYDDKGLPVPLPDGNYPVFDGTMKLMIYDGKKILYSN